jgi:hypothetical protein
VSSSTAARRRLLEPVLRRAGGTARATRRCASSMGVGRSARRAQMATDMSGARCSSATAMVVARRGGGEAFISGREW